MKSEQSSITQQIDLLKLKIEEINDEERDVYGELENVGNLSENKYDLESELAQLEAQLKQQSAPPKKGVMDSIKEGLSYAGRVIGQGALAVVKAVVFIVCLPFKAVYAAGSFIGSGITALFKAGYDGASSAYSKYQFSNKESTSSYLVDPAASVAPASAPAAPAASAAPEKGPVIQSVSPSAPRS